MLRIPYTASKFGRHWGQRLKGDHQLNLTWNELVWAAMTMGKPGVAFLLAHGWHSISDLVVRSHTVYANLCENGQFIEKSTLYAGLDPTEKSGVSYFMGMLAAKVMGHRLLNVPWFFHLSMLNSLGGTVSLKGKSEPDLIGLRNNKEWVIAEAKGRTWAHSKSAMEAAKKQTRQIRKINGQYPSLRVAVQASFSPSLRWAIEDPEEFDDNARDLQFDIEDLLAKYYSASLSAIEKGQERTIGKRKFIVRELPEIGVSIGIDREARVRLNERTMSQALNSFAEGAEFKLHQQEFVIFPDGLAIALDDRWSESLMSLDPWSRKSG
tara:strand:- start:644 stop:1612 length:969 start_codon:yes stop_codon:yes gene_type:complete